MGSLAAIPFGWLIVQQAGPVGLALAALSLLCIGTVAADYYGRKSGTVDDSSIVVDEVVGLWIAAIPAADYWDLWVIAFVLFRLFDVWKPWPASWFDDRSTGGMDVMMDDVVAGSTGGMDVMMDDVVAGFYAFLGTAAVAGTYL
jgi:phosphatidylglycerophosphatase A